MSSDEEDYMSDKFLEKNIPNVRPGLIKNRERQREVEVESKKAKYDEETKKRNKPSHVVEKERLQEGLSTALNTDNKGFALLTKMGYKKGEAIGKAGNQGILEPIGITLKSGRGGLGREAALRELEEKKMEILRQKAKAKTEPISAEEFRRRMFRKAENRQIEADLSKCQRTCERLDQSLGIQEPEMEWFWPPKPKEIDEEAEEEEQEAEEEDFDPAEKLEMLTNYVRSMHLYCHWCGIKYNDIDDLVDSCPGATKDDH
uniref:G patch domain-containing protein 11 n=1 Tax=Nyssomyia neivai TaxID=330878 RepID=A0A1L8DD32_9DIPT